MNVATMAACNSAIMAANMAAMSARRRRLIRARVIKRLQNKQKGIRSMSNDLIREFIGKEVLVVTVDNTEYRGRLVTCEDNWIKIEEKRNTRLINADVITAISYKTLNL